MKKTKRLLTSLLASAMVLASAVPVFAAEKDDTAAGTSSPDNGGSGAATVIDLLNNISYGDYLEKYKDMPAGRGEVKINGVDYDETLTTATVSKESGVYGEKDEVLLVEVDGDVTWTFDVENAGMYNVEIEYAGVAKEGRDGVVTSTASNIERVFYLNGTVPFSETRLVSMKKTWTYEYTLKDDGEYRFKEDAAGNEARPPVRFVGQWESTRVSDISTYYSEPFTYYFKEGTNTISLQGIREDAYIRSITLKEAETLPSYADVLEEYKSKGYSAADAKPIHINAETPAAVSSSTINPNYDRSSAITEPQDATAIKRNTIGGSNWSNTSDWVRYTVNVEKAGLYNIVTRFKQDSVPGSFVSRTVKIDGEYPFAEARFCTFDYSQEWQVGVLGNRDNDFEFYLEPGEHTIEFMATVGSFGEILTRVENIADDMNDAYLQIVKLTGPYPDTYRDYGFSRVMPEAIIALSDCAKKIDEIIGYIGEMSGGDAYNVANLESAALTLKKMSESERAIAENLSIMKSDISNLSTWCSDLESQPLMFDYIQVQPVGASLPEANAGFFDSLKYEFGQFIGSFYTDYNSYDDGTDKTDEELQSIECWMSSGRDRATIIRDLVNSGFCADTGISVSLKLVDAGALLPSVLAGIGPDISLDGVATIDYAIRGAVLPLNDREGFDEIKERFYDSTLVPLSLYGKTYALPVGVDFNMMFTRNDILANLGVEAPETWEDFLALIPVLQYNNMTVIVPSDSKMFLYQAGGNVWDEDLSNPDNPENGWKTTFNDDLTLTCFTKMCEMYTQYSLLASADFQTRFKTGVAPVAITSYSAYTTLTVFAPEIAGLWSMNPIPGTVVGYNDDGSAIIDNTAIATTSGISMLKGVSDEDATWKFMCWYTDVDFQVDLCNELISLLGPAAKTTTANIKAMAEMPWSASEYASLIAQYEHSVGIPQYPGHYVIERYLGMAFQAAYNDGANPAEALLQYVNAANNEISRKRTEFKLPIYDASKEEE